MPEYLHVISETAMPHQVYRYIKDKKQARKAIAHWIKHGFDFACPTANGWHEEHHYPTRSAVRCIQKVLDKLLDDIHERGHDIPFDIYIHGEDDGSYTLDIKDWDSRDEVSFSFYDDEPYAIRVYDVPKTEDNTLGCGMDSFDVEWDKLIDEYEWLLNRRNEVANA